MRVGEVVGNYRITGKLGAGGMGAVYLAKHTLIGREAAIKVLLPELCGNEAIVARFFNEARSTTSIKHPGIVEIYDFGYADDGSAYLVMERLEGEALGARLKRMKRLPVEQALSIARQVTGALHAAHKLGIVHRDLKPDNVFIVPDAEVMGGERAKVLDFGIAKLRDKGEFNAFETEEGTVMGAPTYMAPEQFEGAEKVDHRADQYSIGCILFEMLCGAPPFDGKVYGDVMAQQLRKPPRRPSTIEPAIPSPVEELVLKLLAKRPENRYRDAFELLQRLHQLSGVAPPQASSGAIPVQPPIEEVGSPFESVQGVEPVDGKRGMTTSGVMSSARRTLALGPKGRPGAGSPPAAEAAGPASAAGAAGRLAAAEELASTVPAHIPPIALRVPLDRPTDARESPGPPKLAPSLPPPRFPPASPGGEPWRVPSAGPSMPTAQAMLPPSGFPAPAGEGSQWLPPPLASSPPMPHSPSSSGGMMPMVVPSAPAGAPTLFAPAVSPAGGPPPPPYHAYRDPSAGGAQLGTVTRAPRSGKLGLIVILLALAVGGMSAYFIATSEDISGSDDLTTGSLAGQPAGNPPDSSSQSGSASGSTAGSVSESGSTSQSGPASGSTSGSTAGSVSEPGSGSTSDSSSESGSDSGSTPLETMGEVDDETNRRPTALVTIRINSLPKGASVIRRSDGVRLGETPYTYEVEPQGGSIAFVLRHKGYRDEQVSVPGNRSSDRTVPLTRSTGADRAPSIHD